MKSISNQLNDMIKQNIQGTKLVVKLSLLTISNPTTFDETSLWLEVVGGKKKGRVYGMGLEAHVIPGSYHVLSQSLPPPPPQSSSISLADQIQQAVSSAINATIEPFHHRLLVIEEKLHNPSSSSPPSDPSDH